MLHWQCLEVRKKTLGEMHPDTLNCLNKVASDVSGQGNYAEAEILHWKCWVAAKKKLGESHPFTLNTLNDMA
eukprot:5560485-Ditylum_brightwellii.AAC.1